MTYSLLGLLVAGSLGMPSALALQVTEDLTLLAPDGQADDRFGAALAGSGALLLVGAPGADDLGQASGSAYVLVADTGAQVHELHAADGAAGDGFGATVALDGGLALVGAPSADVAGADSGAVYVFDAGTGAQLHKLVPADAATGDLFGGAVALADGLIVVGAIAADGVGPDAGAAYLFDAATGAQLHKLVPGDASFLGGFGGAVDLDDGRVAVGAKTADTSTMFSGAAYLFDAATGAQTHKLQPQLAVAWAGFGCDVAIDDATVVVGAKDEGPHGKHSGAAYLFDAGSGQQAAKLFPADGTVFDRFGTTVAAGGGLVVVGAPDDAGGGSAYLYDAQGGLLTKLLASGAASGDDLGAAMAVDGGLVALGAPGTDDLGSASGAVLLFAGGASVVPMSGCLPNAGTLVHAGGLPVPGQGLTFILADGQPGASVALLALATAAAPGWPACGLPLGQAGELLVDPSPGSLLPLQTTAYTGVPAVVQVPVPALSGLAGLPVYAQAAFLAAGTAEPLRLSGGLMLTLGGFL